MHVRAGDGSGAFFSVVPAKAGTHTPQPTLLEKEGHDYRAQQLRPVVMGPGLRRDDD
jgi:hypothetical protein